MFIKASWVYGLPDEGQSSKGARIWVGDFGVGRRANYHVGSTGL